MKVAILVPCYNEELTIAKVIRDFKHELPNACIFVYDNNSTDKTSEIALNEGAIVRREPRQGKGNVVRSMFRDVDADIYVLVDGDDTYPANEVHGLIKYVESGEADMVIGDRLSNGRYQKENKRNYHEFGNKLVQMLVNSIFKSKISDIMTGFRVYNRFFVKNFPILSKGFQIETEMTVFMLNHNFKYVEVPITYRDRPEGSYSKLNTVRDGMRVLNILYELFKHTRPMLFFLLISGFFLLSSLIVGIPVIVEFIETHFITLVPSAILASGLVILSSLFLVVALILDTMAYYNRLDFESRLNTYIEQRKHEFGASK